MEPPRVDNADLERWRALWEQDARIAAPESGGGLGAFFKKLLRPFTVAPQRDLWERQRLYNLLVQHHLEARHQAEREDPIGELRDITSDLGRTLEKLQADQLQHLRNLDEKYEREVKDTYEQLVGYIDAHEKRVLRLEEIENEGFDRLRQHQDALFALLDQKLDRYRRQAIDLQGQLTSLLEIAREGGAPALDTAVAEQGYLELERRHRGTEEEITGRIEPYLPYFTADGPVLDLGCGRGEALEVLRGEGREVRGVDSNAEMVARCREKGLDVVEGDLFEVLQETDEASLGGVVSFHVIEHLPAAALDRLIRLSWRALVPGGVLVLETPSPLSLVVGASNFWLDPTHQRPVHPESLRLAMELAGFESVGRVDRQPFDASARLREVPLEELAEEVRPLAHQVNLLRDQIDGLLFGFQDYGMVGHKPSV